jgi:translation initiation factor 2 subunit 2
MLYINIEVECGFMEYEEMLKGAYEKLSKIKPKEERFEVPIVESMIQGNQTVIRNFGVICQKLRREPKHVLKFFTKELAAPGSTDDTRAILQTKVHNRQIQQKLEVYIRDFVFCKECKRPDTKLTKEGKVTIMKCEACGARATVKTL